MTNSDLEETNMKANDKRAWNTPRLKVLVRGTAEEKVLTACKYNGGAGPDSYNCIRLAADTCQALMNS